MKSRRRDVRCRLGTHAARCGCAGQAVADGGHAVELLGVRALTEGVERRLLDGARSGSPEDCGGLPGYERAAQFRAAEDPWGEVADLAEWLCDRQPEGFELVGAQAGFDR